MKKLENFIEHLYNENLGNGREIPRKNDVNRFINDCIGLLFPMSKPRSVDEYHLGFDDLSLQLKGLLYSMKESCKQKPEELVERFFGCLPDIYKELVQDAEAIYQFDPAAASIREVVNAYPGFFAIAVYRISHCLVKLDIPVLPRMVSEHAHSVTGIDINPGATIGQSFFIDHGTGVVIGETSEIGNNVKIYQGVTLGAINVEKSMAATKRHPTIEDNVVIYAGSTVLGGKTVIGHDSVIGGNVFLTSSVPPHSVVYHTSQVKIRKNNKNFKDPVNFSI